MSDSSHFWCGHWLIRQRQKSSLFVPNTENCVELLSDRAVFWINLLCHVNFRYWGHTQVSSRFHKTLIPNCVSPLAQCLWSNLRMLRFPTAELSRTVDPIVPFCYRSLVWMCIPTDTPTVGLNPQWNLPYPLSKPSILTHPVIATSCFDIRKHHGLRQFHTCTYCSGGADRPVGAPARLPFGATLVAQTSRSCLLAGEGALWLRFLLRVILWLIVCE